MTQSIQAKIYLCTRYIWVNAAVGYRRRFSRNGFMRPWFHIKPFHLKQKKVTDETVSSVTVVVRTSLMGPCMAGQCKAVSSARISADSNRNHRSTMSRLDARTSQRLVCKAALSVFSYHSTPKRRSASISACRSISSSSSRKA